jgi:DNA-binding response OmpR family regulator
MVRRMQRTILLIEADASLRWLIALGIRQHDLGVIEAHLPLDVSTLAVPQPDLLVLDVDNGIHCDWSLVEEAQHHPLFTNVPIVVLSWEPAPSVSPISSSVQQAVTTTPAQVTYLLKPFDARVLYATIEQLLSMQAIQEAALAARTEEALLAAYSAHASTSIWPVVTAAGLLLAFIGMMLNIVLIIPGCAVMVTALLLWTLGTQPEQRAISAG